MFVRLHSSIHLSVISKNLDVTFLNSWHIININNVGPRTLPWGALLVTATSSEHSPPTLTYWVLSVKKSAVKGFVIYTIMVYLSPVFCERPHQMPFVDPDKQHPLAFIPPRFSLIFVKSCVVHDPPDIKPYCWSTSSLFCAKCWLMASQIKPSKTLQTTEVSFTGL